MKFATANRVLVSPAPSRKTSAVVLAAVFAATALGLLVIAHGMERGAIPFPGCGFKYVTGLACPGCGGTRSLTALLAREPLTALALNPGVAIAWWLAIASVPLAAIDAACARGRGAAGLSRFAGTRAAVWLVSAAIVANWIFLIVMGR